MTDYYVEPPANVSTVTHVEERNAAGAVCCVTPVENTVDMVNHPPHYKRGPKIQIGDNPATTGRDTMNWIRPTVEYGRRIFIEISCLDVIRWIPDIRLATAMKCIWRVGFGGKDDGTMSVEQKKREDIQKAIVYLTDWLDNPLVGQNYGDDDGKMVIK